MLVQFLLFSFVLLSNFASAKISSLDLCADQWLMAMADPEQVAFLTPLSQDSDISYYHHKSHRYNIKSPDIETLLTENIKIVLATNPVNPSIKKLLKQKGIKVVVVPTIETVGGLIYWTKKIETITGKKYKKILELQLLNENIPPKKKALFVGMGNSSPGTNTLVNHAMTLAGFHNINMNKGWGYVDIETIIKHTPDIIFTTGMPRGNYSFSSHPSYKKLTQSKVVPVSQKLTVCAFPQAFIDLVRKFGNEKS